MWPRRDSNPQPTGYEPAALTVELQGLDLRVVQGAGIEPALGPHLGHTRYKLVGTSSYTNLAYFFYKSFFSESKAKNGDDRGTRTLTLVRALDFKSNVAAITPYRRHGSFIECF